MFYHWGYSSYIFNFFHIWNINKCQSTFINWHRYVSKHQTQELLKSAQPLRATEGGGKNIELNRSLLLSKTKGTNVCQTLPKVCTVQSRVIVRFILIYVLISKTFPVVYFIKFFSCFCFFVLKQGPRLVFTAFSSNLQFVNFYSTVLSSNV